MDRSPPGFSVHGILQARILDWVAMPSSRGSSQTQGLNLSISCLLHWQADFFYHQHHLGSPRTAQIFTIEHSPTGIIMGQSCLWVPGTTQNLSKAGRSLQWSVHGTEFGSLCLNSSPPLLSWCLSWTHNTQALTCTISTLSPSPLLHPLAPTSSYGSLSSDL